jgi:hypothetical protein
MRLATVTTSLGREKNNLELQSVDALSHCPGEGVLLWGNYRFNYPRLSTILIVKPADTVQPQPYANRTPVVDQFS